MKKIELGELQSLELEMLKELDSFCKKNEIKYFLGCGTLCGAVVRGGFFPWDDDIDILMPRADYEKFINTFSAKKRKILTIKNNDYYYPYAKMVNTDTIAYECKNNINDYGVFIDIFPIDGVPNRLYLFLLKPLKYLMMSQWGCHLDNRGVFVKIMYKILGIITKIFPKNFFAKKLDSRCKKYPSLSCLESGIVCHFKNNNEIVNSDIFKESTIVNFEGSSFPAPKLYEKYLTCLYGDYKKEDTHISHKHFRAYWK